MFSRPNMTPAQTRTPSQLKPPEGAPAPHSPLTAAARRAPRGASRTSRSLYRAQPKGEPRERWAAAIAPDNHRGCFVHRFVALKAPPRLRPHGRVSRELTTVVCWH